MVEKIAKGLCFEKPTPVTYAAYIGDIRDACWTPEVWEETLKSMQATFAGAMKPFADDRLRIILPKNSPGWVKNMALLYGFLCVEEMVHVPPALPKRKPQPRRKR